MGTRRGAAPPCRSSPRRHPSSWLPCLSEASWTCATGHARPVLHRAAAPRSYEVSSSLVPMKGMRAEQSTRSALPIPAKGRAADGDAAALKPVPDTRAPALRLGSSGGGSCPRDHGRQRLRPSGDESFLFWPVLPRDFTNVFEPDFCTSYVETFDDVCLRAEG